MTSLTERRTFSLPGGEGEPERSEGPGWGPSHRDLSGNGAIPPRIALRATRPSPSGRERPVPLARADIVAAARSWIGTPYRHQASLKSVGCDCLGLLRGVWRDVLGAEPEAPPSYGRDPAGIGRETLLDAATRHLVRRRHGIFEPGDVLLLRWRDRLPATHCAIVSGEGAMIHAHEGAAVAEVAIAPWWERHLAAVFSFPGAEP